jgi:L-lactate dehydrogenase complex protein LldF
VYRRSGGHSYNTTVPGPIGSILAPVRDAQTYADLPHACSLCGSCSDVCPVKIDIHHQLLTLRREIAVQGYLPWTKRVGMRLASAIFRRPWLYRLTGRIGRWALRHAPRLLIYNRFNPWGRQRELPIAPKKTFRQLYRQQELPAKPQSSSDQ